LVSAVASGRLPEERLADAAEAVTRIGRLPSDVPSIPAREDDIGAVAARRAVRARGVVAIDGSPVVVELEPEPMIAAGPLAHGIGAEISARRLGSTVVALHEAATDNGELLRSAEGRPLVVVLRDAARHRWQQKVASELLDLRPDAVIVETGVPGWRPDSASAFVETYGAARVNVDAAADLLVAR
jgi:beta-N-acetylhexosaminidase